MLKPLEPSLAPGTLVVGGDSTYARRGPASTTHDPANGYRGVGFPVEDGTEISCRR
ncbi:methyltransferase [Streptomyces sp. NPDC051105]|uniref:methyltransferase n=1 Tax=Streptomyces sp. NPDC051105 TaxID=3154843 RepID=UPI0034149F4A